MTVLPRLTILCFLGAVLGCHSKPTLKHPDHPKLSPTLRMIDITTASKALKREMTARVIVPSNVAADAKLPVVYLLHGAGEDYTNWTNNSDIASFAENGVVLVMPDGGSGYYINDDRGAGFQYEDYFLQELIPEIHQRFPFASSARNKTAIVGISRGGFGAAGFALRHLDKFSYVGGMSSAFDLAERPFRIREPLDSFYFRKVFGPPGSATRKANDPYLLIKNVTPQTAPYFYLTCGDQDTLLSTTKKLATLLDQQGLPHEFHLVKGGHHWGVWAPQLPALEKSLMEHFSEGKP